MTDDNSNELVDMNLTDFEAEFYGKTEAPKEVEDPIEDDADNEDEVDENEDNHLATDDEDTDADADEAEDEDEDDEEPEEEPKSRPKSRAQKRIEDLVARTREQERREAELLRRLERLEAEKTEVKTDDTPSLRDKLPDNAPDYNAVDKDGNPVYPLGEFDPNFIRALTSFTIEEKLTETREREAQQVAERRAAEERQALQSTWQEKLERAEEELPDIRENITELVDTFQTLEPQYGEYLATTIMSCENGPEIMNYLSQNIGEAQKIVASGPFAATLMIGKLDAKLTRPAEKTRNTQRVSNAPKPPQERARGQRGQFNVRPDTENLAAFEREFYSKK